MTLKFRILEDRLAKANEPVFLPRAARGLFVLSGGLTVEHAAGNQFQPAGTAFIADESIVYLAGPEGAHLVRWELAGPDEVHDGRLRSAPKATSSCRLDCEITLDPAFDWLMRVDQVTFPPGTIAPVHMHQGPGLRYVIEGEIDHVGPGGVKKVHHPGDVFLENGIDEPVSAIMSETQTTSFLRGLILPRSLKGRSSTRVVQKQDWDTPKPQVYHVHAERYVELPRG